MREVVAYVLSKDGKPLMPMYSHGRVRRLLKAKRAVVKSRVPYVIQLTYDPLTNVTQSITLGIDPGRTNIGVCAITENEDVLYSAAVETRNKEIPKLMSDRKAHRMASRSGERKRRQRKAIANNTTFKGSNIRERILPQCEEPITVHYINNTEARFCNRKRPKDWLTPTANQLLQTHLNVINLVNKILPVTNIVLEINKFDFVKMENPKVKNWEYQKGKLWGYCSVEGAVSARQDGHCIFCKNPIDHYHHVIPKHCGGNESVDNRAGTCEKHHHLVHTETEWEDKLKKKQAGVLKKYHALSVINQIMPYLLSALSETKTNLYVSTGYETAETRKRFGLPKLHYVDAWCIAVSIVKCNKFPKFNPYSIKQFRRQNRAQIHHQTERVYKLDGTVIAKNRNKRTEQKCDSLHEWYEKQKIALGETEARKLLSKLKVTESTRYYNNTKRVLPGAIFIYGNKRCIISGQHNKGSYYNAVSKGHLDFPVQYCKVIKQNTGLVYI